MHACEQSVHSPEDVTGRRTILVSIVVVSFNTRDIMRECLQILQSAIADMQAEVIVVDNNSHDGSVGMIEAEFPWVNLVSSKENLGFAGANNVAFDIATGRYIVLLNSDAFVTAESIRLALAYMEADPTVGAGGGSLVGRDGAGQPSRRMFPSVMNDVLTFTGLAARFPSSRFFGRFDRTWEDPTRTCETDWVPGAFTIIRSNALARAGRFDPDFFLYYEEVDLCRRIKAAGYRIKYWPDVVVVHLGGESSKTVADSSISESGTQLNLWRLRSQYLYYRKHHGASAAAAMYCEYFWHYTRAIYHETRGDRGVARSRHARALMTLIRRAWRDTNGGRISPPRPW